MRKSLMRPLPFLRRTDGPGGLTRGLQGIRGMSWPNCRDPAPCKQLFRADQPTSESVDRLHRRGQCLAPRSARCAAYARKQKTSAAPVRWQELPGVSEYPARHELVRLGQAWAGGTDASNPHLRHPEAHSRKRAAPVLLTKHA